MTTDFREEAEKHWKFIEDLLGASGAENNIPLIHYLYVESMIHGFKHAKQMFAEETMKG